jgi:hypothetical protein
MPALTTTRPATYTETRPTCILIEKPTRDYGRQVNRLEISAQIDTDTRKLTTRYNDPATVDYTYRLLRYENDTAAWYQSEDTARNLVGSAALDQAKKLIDRGLTAQKKRITAGKKHPAYNEMHRQVEKTVKHYEADFFYHDAITLANNPTTPFIWIVREYGTHIIIDPRQLPTVDHCKKNNPDATFFTWSNGKLAKITPDLAAALTAQLKKQE